MSEKNVRLIDAIFNLPNEEGLLSRLAKKDKALSEYYDLQDRFRQGFMLAEEIVKKWAEEYFPMKMPNEPEPEGSDTTKMTNETKAGTIKNNL